MAQRLLDAGPGRTVCNQNQPRCVVFIAATLVVTCLWAGCSRGPQPRPVVRETAAEPYVGAAVCSECHAGIVARQAASHHAQTLRPTTQEWLDAHVPAGLHLTDRETGLEYGFKSVGGEQRQVVTGKGELLASSRLDYLLGSGHHGISPMTYDGSQWRYLSLTYYAAHGWDFSPMHELGDAGKRRENAGGWPVSVDEVRKCYTCHSTRLEFSGAGLDPARSELGVRCESCHGPGRAHVAAARARASDLAINNPRKWSTESFMALCEQCHNENSTLDGVISGIPKDPASPAAVKYHVYALQKSRCFMKSKGALRCTTCHDPHGSAETAPRFYEAKCLSCHAPKQPAQTACPVSPTGGCLPCHMPKVPVEKYTEFADHWIRARSPFAKPAPGSRRSTLSRAR
jgi:hypothetical protein